MSKTITLDDDAYNLLVSLKRDKRDSFTRVILRNIHLPAETCGELLDAIRDDDPPIVDAAVLDQVAGERGRSSGGRK